MNKYGARKTTVNGITFDSRHEALRYIELTYLQRTGQIRDLRLQVTFELLPKQGKERAVKYIADFVYTDRAGETVVEDAKGLKTDVYRLKKKMMRYFHGIEIKEV